MQRIKAKQNKILTLKNITHFTRGYAQTSVGTLEFSLDQVTVIHLFWPDSSKNKKI